MRFVPDDPEPIFRLRRRRFAPKINPTNGSIQLRFEGIDTLESAVSDPLAQAATDSNLELAGTNGGTETARAHIYSNQIGPNGRPIAFVYASESDREDGSSVFLDSDDIVASINVQQLIRGLAYPLFYDTLFDDLRRRMREISLEARANDVGLWPSDQTQQDVHWTGAVETLPPIFPKLWRRIQAYERDETLFDPERPFTNLKLFVEQLGDERISIPSENRFTGFDDLIMTTDETVRLSVDPHDLVIISA